MCIKVSRGTFEVWPLFHHHGAGLYIIAAARDGLQINSGHPDEARAARIGDGMDRVVLEYPRLNHGTSVPAAKTHLDNPSDGPDRSPHPEFCLLNPDFPI